MDRIEISSIKPGIRFSKPVFFDDGKNMFIESGISIKPYHLAALTKWHIPYLLSDGRIMTENEKVQEEIDELDLEELEEDSLEIIGTCDDLVEELSDSEEVTESLN